MTVLSEILGGSSSGLGLRVAPGEWQRKRDLPADACVNMDTTCVETAMGDLQKRVTIVHERRARHSLECYRLSLIVSVHEMTRPLKAAREELEISLVSEAEIVFITLGSMGRRVFQTMSLDFEVVLIDEACQATEVAALLALVHGCRKLILVGDPHQLSATVISPLAVSNKYDRSLFQRLRDVGFPAHLLTQQYRMHPAIRLFPSKYFYQGLLKDSADIKVRGDQLFQKDPKLGPYAFFDVYSGVERAVGTSLVNVEESRFVVSLFVYLSHLLPARRLNEAVTVITPYSAQVKGIVDEFSHAGLEVEDRPMVCSIDSAQGHESDIIIFSCVRASTRGGAVTLTPKFPILIVLLRMRRYRIHCRYSPNECGVN